MYFSGEFYLRSEYPNEVPRRFKGEEGGEERIEEKRREERREERRGEVRGGRERLVCWSESLRVCLAIF